MIEKLLCKPKGMIEPCSIVDAEINWDLIIQLKILNKNQVDYIKAGEKLGFKVAFENVETALGVCEPNNKRYVRIESILVKEYKTKNTMKNEAIKVLEDRKATPRK